MAPSSDLPELTPDETARYARHLLLPEVGDDGQRRLKGSTVLVVGAGGLGSPVLMYLAAAGVGRLVVVDDDVVDSSNLQRQIVHGHADLGRPKVDSARDRLRDINPAVAVDTHARRFGPDNAAALVRDCDLVVNAADNFPTRYLVSDACILEGRPHVHGAIHRFQGEVSVFPPAGPCYRCLHPRPPAPGEAPSCAEAGVLGVLPGIVGCLQASEAVKCLLGLGEPLAGRLLLIDALAARFREWRVPRRPDCAVCGDAPTIRTLRESAASCTAPAPKEPTMVEMTPRELKAKIDRGDDFVLVDVREPHELLIAAIPGAVSIPLGSLPARAGELDPDAEIVLMCRSGRRSADALVFLQAHGFTNLANLRGGVLAWADDVDPSVAKY